MKSLKHKYTLWIITITGICIPLAMLAKMKHENKITQYCLQKGFVLAKFTIGSKLAWCVNKDTDEVHIFYMNPDKKDNSDAQQ